MYRVERRKKTVLRDFYKEIDKDQLQNLKKSTFKTDEHKYVYLLYLYILLYD